MSERQGLVFRNGFLASGALAILVLLMLFYSTVSGAVDRAASRQRGDRIGLARSTAPAVTLVPHVRSVASLDKSGS